MKKMLLFTFTLLVMVSCGNKPEENVDNVVIKDIPPTEEIITNEEASSKCQVTEVEKIVQGNSMTPLIADGATIKVLDKYYECGNKVAKGDIILYSYKGNKNPLLKMIRATGNDKLEVVGSKLMINDEAMVNSEGKEYLFSEPELKIIKLYIQNNKIPDGSFFVFGDNLNNSTDSRKFGAIASTNFLGKVILDHKMKFAAPVPIPEKAIETTLNTQETATPVVSETTNTSPTAPETVAPVVSETTNTLPATINSETPSTSPTTPEKAAPLVPETTTSPTTNN